jgi:hypothetical protein
MSGDQLVFFFGLSISMSLVAVDNRRLSYVTEDIHFRCQYGSISGVSGSLRDG